MLFYINTQDEDTIFNVDPTVRRYWGRGMPFRSTLYKATESTSKQLEKRLTVVLKTIWSTHKNCSQHKIET